MHRIVLILTLGSWVILSTILNRWTNIHRLVLVNLRCLDRRWMVLIIAYAVSWVDGVAHAADLTLIWMVVNEILVDLYAFLSLGMVLVWVDVYGCVMETCIIVEVEVDGAFFHIQVNHITALVQEVFIIISRRENRLPAIQIIIIVLGFRHSRFLLQFLFCLRLLFFHALLGRLDVSVLLFELDVLLLWIIIIEFSCVIWLLLIHKLVVLELRSVSSSAQSAILIENIKVIFIVLWALWIHLHYLRQVYFFGSANILDVWKF